MNLIEQDPSQYYERAFCRNSVRLWCDGPNDSVRELAVAIEDGGRQTGASVCVARTRGNERRIWIPYIEVDSEDAASLNGLLNWTWDRLGVAAPSATAFAEVGTDASASLVLAGWRMERTFPLQLLWPTLETWKDRDQLLPDGVTVDVTASIEDVAPLFVEAFLGEWGWYFEEMGYNSAHSTRDHLVQLAGHFVSGADAYFIARERGKAIGLSSVLLQRNSNRAEFHTGVGVIPSGRGLGLGRILTDFTLRWAKSWGMTSAEVRTQERANVRNRNVEMYRASGASRAREFALFRSL